MSVCCLSPIILMNFILSFGLATYTVPLLFSGVKSKEVYPASQVVQSSADLSQNIRVYPCSVCKYMAVTQSVLKIHMLTHTGERPHVCSMCGKSFRQSGTMYRHEQYHCKMRPGITKTFSNTF